MTLTSDLLDQFQENKVLGIAKATGNVLDIVQGGNFVIMETVTLSIRSSEKCLFGFSHSNSIVKTNFSVTTVVH